LGVGREPAIDDAPDPAKLLGAGREEGDVAEIQDDVPYRPAVGRLRDTRDSGSRREMGIDGRVVKVRVL
jgi:hypothetical protein